MHQENAQVIALQALEWVAGNDELFPVFLGASGASIEDVRNRAGDSEFQLAVLDFLLMDDDWVLAFSQAMSIDPQSVWTARQSMPGGGDLHWT